MGSNISNTLMAVVTAALFSFVVGFAYGNLFDLHYGFELKNWQTLVGACIAIAAALIAYIGVRGTQRVNVMLREEERIEKTLPGLHQAHDLFSLLLRHVGHLSANSRYLVREVINDVARPKDNETYEEIGKRLLPLVDGELQREATALIFQLMTQAQMLKVMKDEVDRTRANYTNKAAYDPSAHEGLWQDVERVAKAAENEDATFMKIVSFAERMNAELADRIREGTERRKLIRSSFAKYFREW